MNSAQKDGCADGRRPGLGKGGRGVTKLAHVGRGSAFWYDVQVAPGGNVAVARIGRRAWRERGRLLDKGADGKVRK